MTPELRTLIEFADRQASKTFRRCGQVLPLYHAVKRNGDQLIMAAPDGDKDTGVAIVRAAFEIFDVVRYVFMDEAWILDAKRRGISAAEMERISREGLSQHPDRREVLMFVGEDAAGGMVTAHRFILRPEHGKPRLTELEYMEGFDMSHGRMVGLLPRPEKLQ